MPESYQTQLGAADREKVWESSFNGAQYRWAEDQWQVKTSVADWHPVKPMYRTMTVYAGAGERFTEVIE